jgi:long-subunit fatty acid transport protein
MKPRFIYTLWVVLCIAAVPAGAQLLPILGAQRTGTATAGFLKIGVGARAAGMGESFIAVANDASALYYNPAGILQFTETQVILSHTDWLVDLKHQFAGAVYHISNDDAVGVSVTSLHTDDMEITTEARPDGTGEYFRYADLAVGLTYARRMTDQFSIGATVRYLDETLASLHMRGLLVDFGTYYWTGLGTTRFSAVVSNFGNQLTPEGTAQPWESAAVAAFQTFPPPTMFRIGFAWDPVSNETHVLTTSLQLNHPNDNAENLALGVEYGWQKTFYARAGYKINVAEEALTLGAGVEANIGVLALGVDYAYASFTNLGVVHRISLLMKL